jgi:ribosomal protein S18 acetylase RimI-like enzyme
MTPDVAAVVTDRSEPSILPAMKVLFRESARHWTVLRGGEVFEDGDMIRLLSEDPLSYASGVIETDVLSSEADARIDETVASFRARGLPWTWWVEPWTRPPDLDARLSARGLRVGTRIPRLAANLRDVLRPGEQGVDGLVIRPVVDRSSEAGWLGAMAAGFDQDDVQVRALERMCRRAATIDDDIWTRFVGSLDGRAVASSGVICLGGLALVINVGTLPDVRRRGIGRAMTIAACAFAMDRGYRVAALGTSDMARGIYERLGFAFVGESVGYVDDGVPA